MPYLSKGYWLQANMHTRSVLRLVQANGESVDVGQFTCRHPTAMLCVLWLGSSVGNLKPHEAVGFFQSMQQSAGAHTQVWLY